MTSPEQPSATSRRDARPGPPPPHQPLSRREMRAREQALASGALLLDASGEIRVNPNSQEIPAPSAQELENLNTGAVLADGTVLTRRLLRELREAAAAGEPDAVSALSEVSALTAATANTAASALSADEPTPPAVVSRRSIRQAQADSIVEAGASFEQPGLTPPIQAQAIRDLLPNGELGPIEDLERTIAEPDEQVGTRVEPEAGYTADHSTSTMIPAITGSLSAYEDIAVASSSAEQVSAAEVPTPVRPRDLTTPTSQSSPEPEPGDDDVDDATEIFTAPVTWKPLTRAEARTEARSEVPARTEPEAKETAPKERPRGKASRTDSPSTPRLLKLLQWIVIILGVAVLALLIYVLATQDDPLWGGQMALDWHLDRSIFLQGDA